MAQQKNLKLKNQIKNLKSEKDINKLLLIKKQRELFELRTSKSDLYQWFAKQNKVYNEKIDKLLREIEK